jgi:hypothetical protein
MLHLHISDEFFTLTVTHSIIAVNEVKLATSFDLLGLLMIIYMTLRFPQTQITGISNHLPFYFSSTGRRPFQPKW